MAKTINELSGTSTVNSNDYFVKCDDTGVATKIKFGELTTSIASSFKQKDDVIAVVNTNSKYNSLYYDNYNYIVDGGARTRSYTATQNCIVFYHIEWDCNGNDGLQLQLLKDGKIMATIPVSSNFEGINSHWLNTNGTVPLGPGITMQFVPTQHSLNTASGNHMNLLVVTI